MSDTETEFLIAGAGPAGAALACFLSQHGFKGIMIAAAPGTADTPRAHITNMAALECLRDIGLDRDCLELATKSGNMEHTLWCHDMAGEEYGRIHSWGHDPNRHGDYAAASPCDHVDLPQTLLEPILVKYAVNHGWDVRFSHRLTSFTQESATSVVTEIEDRAAGKTYKVKSKYLFGCDGARSQVMRQLGIPLISKPGGGVAMNVLANVDLTKYAETRVGNLHWCMQPERDPPEYAWMAIARMVRPWTEWIFIIFPKNPEADVSQVTEEEWVKEVREYIGDDSIPMTVKSISSWKVNEIVAERYSEGINIHCLGDAVHRHPPFNGLGSNTCIQDAYNLAWKVAYVEKGIAAPTLLETFSPERQPVGVGVITRANQGFRDHTHVWNAMGLTEPDQKKRIAAFEELKEASPAGKDRRKRLREAIYGTRHEFHAVGQEMNQRYESTGVYLKDEGPRPPLPENAILDHEITTYPGSRLPHAWLNTRIPGQPISTIDLAGHGSFCLLTGIGGGPWKTAAEEVGKELNFKISAYSIGWCQDYEDVYSDWENRNEIEEDGAILVRPDRFVCWRSKTVADDCTGKLRSVLKSILGL